MRALALPLLLSAAALWAAVGCQGGGGPDEPSGVHQTGLGHDPISDWPEKPVGGPISDWPGNDKLPPSSNGSGVPVVLDAGVLVPPSSVGGATGAPIGAGSAGGSVAGGSAGGTVGVGGLDAAAPPLVDGSPDAGAPDGGALGDGAAEDAESDAGDAGAHPFPFALPSQFPIPRLF